MKIKNPILRLLWLLGCYDPRGGNVLTDCRKCRHFEDRQNFHWNECHRPSKEVGKWLEMSKFTDEDDGYVLAQKAICPGFENKEAN